MNKGRFQISDIFNITTGTAVVFIGLLFAVWAKITGDLKPLAIFAILSATGFLIGSLNYVIGKLSD